MKQIIHLKEPIGHICNAKDMFNKIKKIDIDHSQENFLVFFLNIRKKLLGTEVIFKGGVNECQVDPKILFRKALLKNSVALIIAHNHPSGDLSPSSEDIKLLKDLKTAGDLLSIDILDSIIFNETEYYSLRENLGADY